MALIEIYADTRGEGRCRSCGKAVEWATNVKSGKKMPWNGPIFSSATTHEAETHRVIETVDTSVTSSHFETCPQSKSWRR